MADASFDVVFIGGGNKALVTAGYLTKYGGMSVGIFEARHELGTAWMVEEGSAPGFLGHTHSHAHAYEEYWKPVLPDFAEEWEEYGPRHVTGLVSLGAAFEEDDTWCAFYNYHKDPTQERTAEIIRRFSEKDAETHLWMWDKITNGGWGEAFYEEMYSPPPPPGELTALEKLLADPNSGFDPFWMTLSPIDLSYELFESPEAQCLYTRTVQSIGCPAHVIGGTFAFLLSVLWDSCVWEGGNHQLAHFWQRVIVGNGGKVFTKHPVEKILIENGKATGIRLEDGAEIEAKKAVVSGASPQGLIFDLIGKEFFGANSKIVRRVENITLRYNGITWYTWALNEKPELKCDSFHPDGSSCLWLSMASKDLEDLREENIRREAGLWPNPDKMQVVYSHHSYYDPSYAPPGKHAVLTEVYVPMAGQKTEEEWKVFEKQHAEDVVNYLSKKFIPNFTWDNVIGYHAVTPFFTSRNARNFPNGCWSVIDNTPSQVGRYGPTPDLARYKVPGIENIYASSGGWQYHGTAHASQGYNCYKIMADDFGLRKPWEEKGRRY